MRILLVNTNRKPDLLAAPPLGLCYVASATEAAGHEVKVVDLCFAGSNYKESLRKAIQSFNPEVIGLSIRNIDNVNILHPVSYLPEVLEVTETIRRCFRSPIVVGGSGASLMPESVLKMLQADFIVVSDGESCFVELLRSLERGESPEAIPGVGMMLGDKFHITEPVLGEFKGPAPDLGRWIDTKQYNRIGGSYNIQSKRGCRQKCIYCTYNQSLEGNKLRLRSPVEVVDEIEEALTKYRPKIFEFVDSVFNDPLEHSLQILEEIVRRPWKAEFTSMGMHPRNLDKQYLNLMWRAGFRSFMITPESASDKMLRNYRKGFGKDDVVRAAQAVNRTSFAAWWFFMIGGPGENNDTLQESLDFALKYLRKDRRPVTNVAHFFIGVRIYPATKLWEIAFEEGFIDTNADPLKSLWYLSEDLDLDRAVNQMTEAASICSEIYLGFDEKILVFSRAAAVFFKIFNFSRPYWRHFPAANRLGLMTGLRFMYRPPDMSGLIRDCLRRQGYVGRLIQETVT